MLELRIEHCPRDEVDQLIEVLEETGAVSVSMMDQQDNPILEPKPGETPCGITWWYSRFIRMKRMRVMWKH